MDINENPELRLRKIGETSFRDLYHQYIYIKGTSEFLKRLSKSLEVNSEDDGIIAYGYIDEQAGFSFSVLCSANIKNNILSKGKYNEKIGIIMRKSSLNDFQFMNLGHCDIDTSEFDKYINAINENYRPQSKQTEEMRSFTFLDEVRNIDHPDDIQIFLVKDGLEAEQVWGKCCAYNENELFAKLINEPNQDFGVHNGSIISFSPIKFEKSVICVYTGKWLEE